MQLKLYSIVLDYSQYRTQHAVNSGSTYLYVGVKKTCIDLQSTAMSRHMTVKLLSLNECVVCMHLFQIIHQLWHSLTRKSNQIKGESSDILYAKGQLSVVMKERRCCDQIAPDAISGFPSEMERKSDCATALISCVHLVQVKGLVCRGWNPKLQLQSHLGV